MAQTSSGLEPVIQYLTDLAPHVGARFGQASRDDLIQAARVLRRYQSAERKDSK